MKPVPLFPPSSAPRKIGYFRVVAQAFHPEWPELGSVALVGSSSDEDVMVGGKLEALGTLSSPSWSVQVWDGTHYRVVRCRSYAGACEVYDAEHDRLILDGLVSSGRDVVFLRNAAARVRRAPLRNLRPAGSSRSA